MLLSWFAILAGLIVLVWSADRFIEGASATARYAGVSPLLIGLLIIGFGTSAPEMVVSAIASSQGNPGLALGNAYGSNITNIGLVVGIVALIVPMQVRSNVLRNELPVLAGITLLSGWQLLDGHLGRVDAAVLLFLLAFMLGWSIHKNRRSGSDELSLEVESELASHPMSFRGALMWLVLGLLLLIASSRLLVWGAVEVAQSLGISDLIIGLTVVAIGTSLPELASSLAAIRKNEHDMALGNILGSGIFNTLAVVGIAASIHPIDVEPDVLTRDWPVMASLTAALFVMGIGWKGRPGRINRFEGGLLLMAYIVYLWYLVRLMTN